MRADRLDAILFRPWLRLMGVAGLTLVAGGLVCAVVRSLAHELYADHFQRQVDDHAMRLTEMLQHAPAGGSARTMGIANARIKSAVRGELPPDAPTLIESLNDVRDQLGASLAYVLNTSGVVVASTPYDDGQTLTGNNYAFRPYFQAAMGGRCTLYLALGVTTRQRGLYYAAPVLAPREVAAPPVSLGAVVIKMPTTNIDRLFADLPDAMALVSPGGLVFVSNQPAWLLKQFPVPPHTLREVTQARTPSTSAATSATDSDTVEGVDLNAAHPRVNGRSQALAMRAIRVDDPDGDWLLLALRDTAGWAPTSLLAVAFLLSTLVTNACLAAVYLWRRRSQAELAGRCETEVAAATYRTIFDATSDGLFILEIGTARLIGANAEAHRLLRCAPGELTALPVADTPPYTMQEAIEWLNKAATEGRQSLEWLVPRNDGSTFWASVDLQRCFIMGEPRILAVLRDITEQKRSRESLVESRDALRVQVRASNEQIQQLAAAVDQAGESILITNAAGIVEYANPYLLRHTGYTRAEVIGQHVRLFKSGRHDAAFYADLWRTLLDGKTWRGHFINRRKDGSLYEEEAAISPVFSDDRHGTTASYVAVKRDVTGERLLERQVRQSQKMAAVGQLAYKIAHDFTNILAMVLGHAEMARRKAGDAADLRRHIDQVIAAVNRIAPLTAELMTFASPAELRIMPMRLRRAVDGISEILRKSLPATVNLTVDASAEVGKVSIDEGQIAQAVLHLAINAAEAMPNGGALTITTSRVDFDEPERSRIRADLADTPADFVGYGVITISDTGVGIPTDQLGHIFEPFHTTKPDAQNAGLGLATAYRIVAQHKGHITVDSTPGEGSTFRIYLPITAPTPSAG